MFIDASYHHSQQVILSPWRHLHLMQPAGGATEGEASLHPNPSTTDSSSSAAPPSSAPDLHSAADPTSSSNSATPLIQSRHPTYSHESSRNEAEASSGMSHGSGPPSRPGSNASSRRSSSSELFSGLASSMHRGHDARDTDTDLEDGEGSRGGSRRHSDSHIGSPSLAAPLISPTSPGSSNGYPAFRRAQLADNVLRRTIHVTHGEFEMTKSDRVMAELGRSWWQRWSRPAASRHDLFRDNRVKSSRYDLFTFLPLNLFEQLMPHSKPANFYFLIIAFLQCWREVSITAGRPSILLPLLFVLTVTAVKDAVEDYARHKQDRVKNQAVYLVYRGGRWQRILSKNLLVGDLVKIREGQRIPADILLVSSGVTNGGHVFVDTKELDGETNLKPKQVPPSFLTVVKRDWRHVDRLNIDLRTDVPNDIMNAWQGDLTVNQHRENVSIGSFLLTDSVLRNTAWCVGLICYTGEDTKIRQNMAKQMKSNRWKESSVFKLTKRLFVFQVAMQIILCLTAALNAGIFQYWDLKYDTWYIMPTHNVYWFAFLRIFNFFIIVKDFIPISLYVSLELVQFWQALFIAWDREMHYTIAGQEQTASAQTSRLNEELAQVSFIFSDKTGTLTANSMLFRKCIVGKETYGTGTTEAGRLRKRKLEEAERKPSLRGRDGDGEKEFKESARLRSDESDAMETDDEEQVATGEEDAAGPTDLVLSHVSFNEVERVTSAISSFTPLSQRLSQLSSSKPSQDEAVHLFLYALALNNTVFPQVGEADDNGEEEGSDGEEDAHMTAEAHIDIDDERKAVSSSRRANGVTGDEEVELESASPDEKALVCFAQAFGFELIQRTGGKATLRTRKMSAEQVLNEAKRRRELEEALEAGEGLGPPEHRLAEGSYSIEQFEEVALLDFTSKRKRMTVIVRPIGADGKARDELLVFIKGADSALKPFVEQQTEKSVWESTYRQLGEFGNETLRTLVFAYAIKPYSWWTQHKDEYESVQRSPGDTEKGHVEGNCSNECRICKVESDIEGSAGFTLLGASAIEDKLQEGVPHALAQLTEAGISVWMLTGDNLSTGTNIALSCNLLDVDMLNDGRLFAFDRDLEYPEAIEDRLTKCERKMKRAIARHHKSAAQESEPPPTFGLSIHGDVWKILHDAHLDHLSLQEHAPRGSLPPSILDRFFDLASKCKSVVACRLEPKEKADIVQLMRKRTGKTCLAIGDGNNDTPMIKQADIGVGLRGVEGTSAVASSDFVLSQFRFLTRLLFVHGRLNYRRISTLVNYVFYKTSLLVWTLFLFGAFSQFSGSFLYLDWAVQLHNVVFTAWPILVFAVFDRDLNFDTLERNPSIYPLTRGPVLFNARLFGEWMFIALGQACLCFFLPFWSLELLTTPSPNGQSFGIWTTGLCVYTCVVIVSNLKLIWLFQSWTVWHHLTLIGSVAAFFSAIALFSSSPYYALGGVDYYGLLPVLFATSRFWFVVCITVMSCIMWDLAIVSTRILFFITPTRRIIEAERLSKVDPHVVRRVAKQLRKEQLEREQGHALSHAPSASTRTSVISSWDADAAPESRRQAMINRRRGKRDAKQIREEEEERRRMEVGGELSPDPALSPAGYVGGTPQLLEHYTGANFSHTPAMKLDSEDTLNLAAVSTLATTASSSSSSLLPRSSDHQS